MQKYPDATGNQMIQSLVHNTGVRRSPARVRRKRWFRLRDRFPHPRPRGGPSAIPRPEPSVGQASSTAVGPADRRRRTGACCGPARGINRRIAVPLCDHGGRGGRARTDRGGCGRDGRSGAAEQPVAAGEPLAATRGAGRIRIRTGRGPVRRPAPAGRRRGPPRGVRSRRSSPRSRRVPRLPACDG